MHCTHQIGMIVSKILLKATFALSETISSRFFFCKLSKWFTKIASHPRQMDLILMIFIGLITSKAQGTDKELDKPSKDRIFRILPHFPQLFKIKNVKTFWRYPKYMNKTALWHIFAGHISAVKNDIYPSGDKSFAMRPIFAAWKRHYISHMLFWWSFVRVPNKNRIGSQIFLAFSNKKCQKCNIHRIDHKSIIIAAFRFPTCWKMPT